MAEKKTNRRKFIKNAALAGVGASVLGGLTLKKAHAAEKGLNVLVLYYSLTGNTAKAATEVVKGVKTVPGAVVAIRKIPGAASVKGQTIPDVTDKDLKVADCIILGSPVHNANPAGEMLKYMQMTSKVNCYGKFGGAFATGGHAYGGMGIVMNQLLVLLIHKAMVVGGTRNKEIGYGGVGAGAETMPPSTGLDKRELEVFYSLGKDVATSALQWKMGAGAL